MIIGENADTRGRQSYPVCPIQVSRLSLRLRSFGDKAPYRFQIAGYGELDRKNRFLLIFWFILYHACGGVEALNIETICFDAFQCVIELAKRHCYFDMLVYV
jgi:hypothetical protein